MKFDNFSLVFCNGQPPSAARLRRLVSRPASIVCADGGANKALLTGYVPNLVVGDLDSLDNRTDLPPTSEIVRVPSQANTDFEKTLDVMLDRGMDNFLVTAFSGGRIDHTLANLIIAFEYSRKCHIVLADEEYVIFPVTETLGERIPLGTTVSLIAMVDETVITTDGLEFELSKAVLPKGGHGVSNRSAAEDIRIVVREGGLLVMIKDV